MDDEILNKYEVSKQELRELIRDAHGAIKDLRKVLKEAEEQRQETVKALQQSVDEKVNPVIAKTLEDWGAQTLKFINEAEASIFSRFDNLADILLGEDKKTKKSGERSLPEIAADIAVLRKGDLGT